MKALVWHGKEDIRYGTVTDPTIEHPRDAIIKVTSCAICGSDLHLFHNLISAMLPGDVMGQETMGEVVEVGSASKGKLAVGDRVVIPFTIQCGECDQCRRGNFSVSALVAGITVLDVVAYLGVKAVRRRSPTAQRDYSDRSGFPRGAQASRGLARDDFDIPADYRAEGMVADALPDMVA